MLVVDNRQPAAVITTDDAEAKRRHQQRVLDYQRFLAAHAKFVRRPDGA